MGGTKVGGAEEKSRGFPVELWTERVFSAESSGYFPAKTPKYAKPEG